VIGRALREARGSSSDRATAKAALDVSQEPVSLDDRRVQLKDLLGA
jgi:hypothetical protein